MTSRKMRKLIVIAWWFALQWTTEFAVFNIVGVTILAVFLILVLSVFWTGLLLHWQVVFWETQNVLNALQAACPQKQPNRRHCNVTARSKSPEMHLVDLKRSTGLLSWSQSERMRYKEIWQCACALGPHNCSCVWLFSNEAQLHYDITVGCYV